MIIFEGIIGSGKTTLSELFAQTCKRCKLFCEPVTANPYLEQFYKNPAKYGLEMQFWMMATRYQMHIVGIDTEWKDGTIAVYDRSIYGDQAFAYMLNKSGIISAQGYQTYMKMREMMTRTLLSPHIVFYIDISAATAKKRIMERGRECEASIPQSYLENLDIAYKEVVLPPLEKTSKVIMLDGEKSVEENLEAVMLHVEGGLMNHVGL